MKKPVRRPGKVKALDKELLKLIRDRSKEPARPYDEFIKELKRDGLI
jgi:hypothetical protein